MTTPTLTARCVEAMARAIWDQFVQGLSIPSAWPKWEELLAQQPPELHRIKQFRGYARAALRALASELDAAGWQVVPKVATDDMAIAISNRFFPRMDAPSHHTTMQDVFAAGLAAAPAFPELGE